EGQAAMWLEGLARHAAGPDIGAYLLPFDGETWDHATLLAAVLDDLETGADVTAVAARFHHGLADAVVDAARQLRGRAPSRMPSRVPSAPARAPAHVPADLVVLSGGVWQNRLLFERALAGLDAAGF